MNMNSKSGSGIASAIFIILFIASIALNVAFLTGCETLGPRGRRSVNPGPIPPTQSTPSSSEATYLREIATSLGLSPSPDKTPGIIAFDIKQALGKSLKYHDDILSDVAFQECKAAIPTTKDTEIFEAYHRFIKKIAGKRILVLDN
ncbi:MAG: hypothetical protein IJQ73_00385 [Kiritimatiellae bacterium]|nr:hypothetical protein [Kiritimatiellia bacterium]